MKRRRITTFIFSALLVAILGLSPLAAQELSIAKQVIERTLDNGLKVLIVSRPEIPTVRCTLAFRVGSTSLARRLVVGSVA